MSKNRALLLFSIAIAGLIAIVWLKTGSPTPPTGGDAIWFHAGLFTLLIGKYIVEYRFTRPNDVFVNCAIVFASVSVLSEPPNAIWWETIRWSALVIAIGALFLSWDPGKEVKRLNSSWRSFFYSLLTSLGRAEVIFSIVFVLALISYFDLDAAVTRVTVIFWGVILVSSALSLDQLAGVFRRRNRDVNTTPIATVHSFHAPNTVMAQTLDGKAPQPHGLVVISSAAADHSGYLGIITGNRRSPQSNLMVLNLVHTNVREIDAPAGSIVSAIQNLDAEEFDIPPQFRGDRASGFVGTVATGTHISQLQFELFGQPELSAGSLLEVQSGDQKTYFQIFNAEISEEAIVDQSARSFTVGRAEQVGIWDAQRNGFTSHDWVAKERSLVLSIDAEMEVQAPELADSEVSVGHIPKSRFPVVLDLNDWVLFHTAILGVTGSGKSFLTFQIIEEAAERGIKSVCVDPTGDYQRYLPNAVMLTSSEHLRAFLDSEDQRIGIIETASGEHGRQHPIDTTHIVAKRCLDWCKENRTEDEVLNPRAKVQFVLEEAHLLIPEWNFNPDRGKQDRVSQTAQVVLQARKYGLGFLVVSQRTANVVKSVLNQCNTIVSFQAFDETGFDFLSNYMGQHHVRSLPNLKPRQGIVVGKASKSNRPVMARFNDQAREIRTVAAPIMPLPDQENNEAQE